MNISGSEKKTNCNMCCTERRSGHPFQEVGNSSENEPGYRSHRRARTHSARVPRGFLLCSGLHRRLQPVLGSIPIEVKNEDTGSSSLLAGLAPYSQPGLQRSGQSSSVTCARPMASNRRSLLSTHPGKTAKLSEHAAL